MRVCRDCGKSLPMTEFYKSSGLRCRWCHIERTNRWRASNRESANKASRERAAKVRLAAGRSCKTCGVVYPASEFLSRGFTCRTCRDNKNHVEQERQRLCEERAARRRPSPDDRKIAMKEYRRARAAALKAETFNAYGGKCACCGEAQFIFLAIDHIFEGGRQERLQSGLKGGDSFYAWLKKQGYPKDSFQLLCFNCNWARSHGGCPHGNLAGQPIDAVTIDWPT
jgi:DNA-directed RNA polymerase subunit M/transcription elongation factor TFIIS